MLQLLTILGWVIALGCMVYLVAELIERRLSERRRNKEVKGVLQQRFRRNIDPATLTNKVVVHRPHGLAAFGFVALFLWEGYWGMEIANYFFETSTPLRLPYFFLFGVMVGVPLVAYFYSRRVLRRSIHS